MLRARHSVTARSAGALLALLAIGVAPSAHAEEAVANALPPPPLVLTLTEGTGGAPWKIRVENTGDVPIRLAADPRVLVLELTPPAGTLAPPTTKKGAKPVAKAAAATEPVTVRCELPADARPSTDEGRELVLPAKRSFSHAFEPLFYCFGARERAALVPGTQVKARLGWAAPPPKKTVARKNAAPPPLGPPFIASPVGAAVGKFGPVKELESAPLTLTEAANALLPVAGSPGAAAARPASSEAPAPSATPLVVTTSETADALRGSDIGVTVTITNDSERTLTTLFRPEVIRFSVSGPAGTLSCGSTRYVDSPIRELYGSLGPKAKTSITLLVTALCPFDTFDEPGLYRVTPIFDTSAASARSIGLATWDGEVTAKAPLLLRVRTAKRPSNRRPALD